MSISLGVILVCRHKRYTSSVVKKSQGNTYNECLFFVTVQNGTAYRHIIDGDAIDKYCKFRSRFKNISHLLDVLQNGYRNMNLQSCQLFLLSVIRRQGHFQVYH
jgi:hypothetical protein